MICRVSKRLYATQSSAQERLKSEQIAVLEEVLFRTACFLESHTAVAEDFGDHLGSFLCQGRPFGCLGSWE